jgi:hypothetical protein
MFAGMGFDRASREQHMDWIVAVSAQEAASGEFKPETETALRAAFQEHGCVLMRGVFSSTTIDAMYREYATQLGAFDLPAMRAQAEKPPPNRLIGVGGGRYDVTLRMNGVFGNAEVLANPLLTRFLRPLLGKDMRLNSLTVVVSHPGSSQQQAHRDHNHLFPEPGLGPSLPVYAVNVAIPLIDVDLETGPTGVWLGSHRFEQMTSVQASAMVAIPWQRGDCMLMDYRLLHAGLPNRGTQPRPVVYLVYGRRWFADDVNHINRIPLDMALERYGELPEPVRPMLIRAYTHAVRLRWPEADGASSAAQRVETRPAVAVAQPFAAVPALTTAPRAVGDPSWAKTGRNEPCPCGSGKKYKHCHGRNA